jgi:hypothetical protein
MIRDDGIVIIIVLVLLVIGCSGVKYSPYPSTPSPAVFSHKMDQLMVPVSNWVSVASSVTKSNALQASETQKNQAIVNQPYHCEK